MKKAALIFSKVQFSRGSFTLDVDVHFQKGKFTVVLGPSGCGKTTMLDLAAGFLQPSTGLIMEGERNVTPLPPNKRKVGVVFQDHALFPHLSVRENVAYGPKVRGAGRSEANYTADRYLEMIRMTGYAGRKPSSLSGGERQRVSLARALAIEPDLLLMDEPFSSLDAALRRSLRNEVRVIQKETGITALLVTHDQDEALALADDLAVMRNGKIVQKGSPESIWKKPADLFTALFVGRTTRVAVNRIYRGKNGRRIIETRAGKLEWPEGTPVPDLPATLIIRPEDLIPTENGILSGCVLSREYSGGGWRVRLETGHDADKIDWDYSGMNPPEVGDRQSFDIRPDCARILAGSAETVL